MHKYNKESTKYKNVPMEDKIFSYLDKRDTNDAETLGMLLAHLSMPTMCCSWVSEEHFISLVPVTNKPSIYFRISCHAFSFL